MSNRCQCAACQAEWPDSVYDMLREARELLGKAHDKIATACQNRGGHQTHLIGVCPAINDLIEKLHDACGETQP